MVKSYPWMTSTDIIEAVKRKISFPISQATFTEEEILNFANEEMAISQIPSILQYHEEYLVTTKNVPLQTNVSRYPIPERAIGLKLRDLFWSDAENNLFEMTRVSSDDRAFFQRNIGANQAIHKFYIEGNDVVLTPSVTSNPTGYLVFVYYLRPNQLVKNDRAAILTYFTKTITIDNSSINVGDILSIDGEEFTAVSGPPSANEFQIGGTSTITATNLVAAINSNGTAIANNGAPSTSVVTIKYSILDTDITSTNSAGINISDLQGLEFDNIPSNITNGSVIDFLQTKAGHKTKNMDVTIGSNAISDSNITFDPSDIPIDLVIGDYICLSNECIIPQIPSDLHISLAERTCARILAAIGDQAGLSATNQKIQEIEVRQGSLIDNRSEGTPQKITARHSLLRYGKMGVRRRM